MTKFCSQLLQTLHHSNFICFRAVTIDLPDCNWSLNLFNSFCHIFLLCQLKFKFLKRDLYVNWIMQFNWFSSPLGLQNCKYAFSRDKKLQCCFVWLKAISFQSWWLFSENFDIPELKALGNYFMCTHINKLAKLRWERLLKCYKNSSNDILKEKQFKYRKLIFSFLVAGLQTLHWFLHLASSWCEVGSTMA